MSATTCRHALSTLRVSLRRRDQDRAGVAPDRPVAQRPSAPARAGPLGAGRGPLRDGGHRRDRGRPRRRERGRLRDRPLRRRAHHRGPAATRGQRRGDDLPHSRHSAGAVPARGRPARRRRSRSCRGALRSRPAPHHAGQAREPVMAVASGGPGELTIPGALPVLPLRDAIVLPLTAVPLVVGQPRSVRLVDDVMRGNRLVALVAQRDAAAEAAGIDDLYRIGTVGVIHQFARVPDGSVRVMVQGLERIRILDQLSGDPYLVARVTLAPEPATADTEADALRRAVVDIFRRLVEVSSELPDELAVAAENIADPRHLAYFVAAVMPLD